MSVPPVLLVEGTLSVQSDLKSLLRRHQLDVVAVGTAIEAQARFRQFRPDIVILSLDLSDGDGVELISEFLAAAPRTRVIVTTLDGSTRQTVKFMRAGAFDVLVKPVRETSFIATLEDALVSLRNSRAGTISRPTEMIGSSQAFLDLLERLDAIRPCSAPVFLTGECGTGKSLTARHIHSRSERASGPFVTVDCATVSAEKFVRVIDGSVSAGSGRSEAIGTVFLDHICDLDFALQGRFLNALENGATDGEGGTDDQAPRLICATSSDPRQDIQDGRLRADLFHRLNVVPIHLPALRDRDRDVLLIAKQAIDSLYRCRSGSFTRASSAVEDLFLGYDWPGNITELLNVVRNAAILHDGDRLTPNLLPDTILRAAPRSAELDPALDKFDSMTLADLERHIIKDALARTDGSVPKAARRLEVSPSTLYRKIEAWTKPEDAP